MKKVIEFVKENKVLATAIGVAVVVLVMSIFGNPVLSPFNG